MYKELKPMLSSYELIDHLETKGISFKLISREKAEKYLKENNNYFKLTSYRKNFSKYTNGKNKGKYINLDFGMLIDLSIIDMEIRKIMLSIVLDLEHYVKIKLLKKLEENNEDGYTIVEEYIKDIKNNDKDFKQLNTELERNRFGTYCGNLVTKYQSEYPVWVFLEIISFGRLIKFYMFVAVKFQDKEMKNEAYMLKNVRELRNACAHNNCIINDLRPDPNNVKQKINYGLVNDIAKSGITKRVRDNKLSNARLLQITTLLYLNKKITTSKGVYKHQGELLMNLKARINKHIYYYNNNNLVQTSLKYLNKIIDIWYTNSI